MLLQVALFHSFLWLSNIPLYIYIYHSFLTYSSVDGHLDCFHVLAIVKSAAVNIRCMYYFELWFSQGICLVVGLLGRMGVLSLVF